jgi:Flp pilus assembly protein TadD
MYTDIEWALSQGLPVGQVVPMVERLMNEAAPGTPHANYAKRQLAELIVRKDPFRAARLSREVTNDCPDDDRALATLGLSCLLMGHYRMAERAYRRALRLVPHCPWYAHNLGHMLDVALGRPKEALPLLKMSLRAMPHEPEIASSYAHALFAAGDPTEGWKQLLASVDGSHARAKEVYKAWFPSEASSIR